MKQISWTSWLIITFLLSSSTLLSKHIIGGEITYVCNGGGNYDFTMKIFRDCYGGGAEFDNPATVTIYRGNSAPYTMVQNLNINYSSITDVPEPDLPCLDVPDDICVEEGIYLFSLVLPTTTESYHIVYQRCCRNNTITNIVNPEDAGATYTIELTPLAQDLCNNSPVYNFFPATVICAGSPLNVDHSATDPDGDQLVYEFCSPILGGGPFGTPDNPGDVSACDGIRPNPACAPPFSDVQYVLSNYSALEPMAGNPVVNINAFTGMITGTPENLGQFVVGVCVKEYRNGQLLSVVRRDFQFNVELCEPTVIALIEHDEEIGNQQYVINSCGNNTIDFINESIQQSNIDVYSWTFDVTGNGDLQEFNTWDATVTFPDVGTYNGSLLLNPGTECADSAEIFVNIFPDINADFNFAYDTCVAGPVTFTDLSASEAGPIVEWDWDFHDNNTSSQENPVHQFMSPGDLPITLTVMDENECVDSTTQLINWFPAPALLLIEPSSFTGCEPLSVFFNNLSFPIDDTYDIVWDFGDGTTSGEISPTHIYDEEGIFDISLRVTSPLGCFVSEAWPNWIEVDPSPTAGFTFSPNNPSNFNPTVEFSDESQDAISWTWDFNGEGFSYQPSPTYTFQDTGAYIVQQIVLHPSGCTDTLIRVIDVTPQIRYYLPNAFTPNFDDKNDLFMGAGFFAGIEGFEMTIWNRWGEMIFESNDPYTGWNGKKFNTGEMSPNGVYVYVVTFTGPRNIPFELKGYATLIK